ncbi:hypothetical protein RF11_09545 [Thelohanellus kitauei]|uniref:Uncharacterized protein n=1 Tax=Thelohanellus kitauei TaxID=669202 RepID=A0A0C2MWZ5_THEKT|nr:hypothetical protein RF11_09545 [Thelohanellus kitauei]
MKDTTTADNLYQSCVESLDRCGVNWKHVVSLVTGGAPQMTGSEVAVAKIWKENRPTLGTLLEFYPVRHLNEFDTSNLDSLHDKLKALTEVNETVRVLGNIADACV